jgi:hypothetical protein
VSAAEKLAETVVAALTDAIRAAVREELAAAKSADPDDWIPHPAWPMKSRRVACELARSGAIPNARRSGKVWIARRRDLEAYLAKQPGAATPPAPTAEIVDFDALRREMKRRPRKKR